jgi:hypothetical protein
MSDLGRPPDFDPVSFHATGIVLLKYRIAASCFGIFFSCGLCDGSASKRLGCRFRRFAVASSRLSV